jgi:hypothetical protein
MTDTSPPVWQLRLTDLWWLLAYPLYQTFGTIRHEGSHAVAAKLEGADVTKFVPYPQTQTGRFTWGYTEWSGGSPGWFTDAAPYLVDLLWFALFFFLLTRIRWTNHLIWLNLAIIGLLSPLVNSLAAWLGGIFGSDQTDVAKWLAKDPDAIVHLYFLITCSAYVIALVAILWRVPKRVADTIAPVDQS